MKNPQLPRIFGKMPFFSLRTYYGLMSPDGTELLNPKFLEIRDYDGHYFAARAKWGAWYCYDSSVHRLILYRFREDAADHSVSLENTLVYCCGFLNPPKFWDGCAAVQTNGPGGTRPWHIITTNGRVLFTAGETEPKVLGDGFFSVKEGEVTSILNEEGRVLMRFPDPSGIADCIPADPLHPVRYEDGQWCRGEYKANCDMAHFMDYLKSLEDVCGLHYTRTEHYTDVSTPDHCCRRMTLHFASAMSAQTILSIRVETEGDMLFFTFCAPAAPDDELPRAVKPTERLLLSADRQKQLINLQITHLDYAFCPADATDVPPDPTSDDDPDDHFDSYNYLI